MFVVFVAVFFVLLMPASLASQSLDWQIQFLAGSTRESRPINEIINMENGERFRMVVRADSDSYCYVVFLSSEREIYQLHDDTFIRRGTERIIGPFDIEPPSGTETIYVIMSHSRQTNLERLIETNARNPSSRQNFNNLFREIGNLQASVSSLGEPATAIITSGGTSRGTGTESESFATRFTGNNMYVRTITIRH